MNMEKIPENLQQEGQSAASERAKSYARIAAFTAMIAASESVAQEPAKVENAKEIPQTPAGEIFKKFESHKLTALERGIITRIDTYNPGDFKRVGIYIRQDHLWPENGGQMKKSSRAEKASHLDRVSDFQEQLPYILDFVHEKSGARSVRIESLTEKTAPEAERAWRDPNQRKQLSAQFGGPILRPVYDLPIKNMPIEYLQMYGGLVSEETVADKPWAQILPGEKAEVIERVDAVGNKYSGLPSEEFKKLPQKERKQFFQLVMKEREDALISMLSQDGGDATIVLYGAGHDFTRAFIEHNNAHPENKHALITITPESLKDVNFVVEDEEKKENKKSEQKAR